MPDKPLPNLKPVLYSYRIHELQVILHSCGYALAIHGSMKNDLDVVAIPWVDNADSAEVLVKRLCKKMKLEIGPNSPSNKPHGRKVWTLLMNDIGFIDLSVVSRIQDLKGGNKWIK